mmetsp:Transcript_40622/g.99777  ORF Transcript_40622/g.99777 Transcript_40622/m.99777 type:complete len:720 (-) Transcript_40622:292-2451(-)
MIVRGSVLLLAFATLCNAQCPFMSGAKRAVAPTERMAMASASRSYLDALEKLDVGAVRADIKALLTNSQDFWPADFGNYGPFFIRLAWHCAGSYRSSDGRGGCDGGRIRFEPEAKWPDNTNLDKARQLLEPIKEKYGAGLSWGDLIVLSGTVAIESMGGPYLGFCYGRVDDKDGSESIQLGPSMEQMENFMCVDDGDCKAPLGATTMGLIYVNPIGPKEVPDPALSVPQIRDTFLRMGMNDTETVALIGGGHAFGKVHGACPEPPCGDGKGENTHTSGLEGPWTRTPTQWTNSYFTNLLNNEWELHTGAGGKPQWRVKGGDGAIMMLTTDISLKVDPEYLRLSQMFANDIGELERQFGAAWFKLMTRDMGPHARCFGPDVPPEQGFQRATSVQTANVVGDGGVYADPATAQATDIIADADLNALKGQIQAMIAADPTNGQMLSNLAYQCASSYRKTDYFGGCNRARIRFSPEKDWPMNVGTDKALALLDGVKASNPSYSWADLITYAGILAVESLGAGEIAFCTGFTDGADGNASSLLALSITDSWTDVRTLQKNLDLTDQQVVALAARPLSSAHMAALGYPSGDWGRDTVSGDFFAVLMNETWAEVSGMEARTGMPKAYKAQGKQLYALETDMQIREDLMLSRIAKDYAWSNPFFLSEFASAWRRAAYNGRVHDPKAYEYSPEADQPLEMGAAPRPGGSLLGALLAAVAALLLPRAAA